MNSSPPSDDYPETVLSEVQGALGKVLASKEFSSSERLTEFLRYVVSEALQGRGDQIRAKTIAEAVYGRDVDDDLAANVVRVDAGRLRRQLAAYYRGAGSEDRVRITVAKGGYAPSFSRMTPQPPVTREKIRPGRALVLGGLTIAIVAILGAVALVDHPASSPPPRLATADDVASAARRAVFEHAPADLEADKLVEQARELMFPAFDRVRLDTAQTLFDSVIDRDCAHTLALAGAAQNHAMIAFLFENGDERESRLARASHYASRAVEVEPSSAWAYSALSWTLFVSGNDAGAVREAQRARSLEPDNDVIQDYEALVYLFSGRFEDAARVSDTAREGLPHGARSPRRNVLGAALFHLGDFDGAAAALASSAESGLPVSGPAFAYYVASVQATGDQERAQTLADELMTNWPNQRFDVLLSRLMRDPEAVAVFTQRLKAAGWRPTGS